jgi:PAS domain S-box-containing protein
MDEEIESKPPSETEELQRQIESLKERNRILEEKLSSEKDYSGTWQEMFRRSPDAMVIVDSAGNIIFANEGIRNIFGYDPMTAMNLDKWFKIVFPSKEYRKTISQYWREDQAMEDPPGRFLEAVHADGRKIWFRIKITKLAIGMFLVSMQDITEAIFAEKRLRQSEVQYRSTIDSIADMIHVVDENMTIMLANSTLKKRNVELGFTDDVIGKTIFEVYPFLSESVKKEYEHVIRTGKILFTEENNLLKNSEMFTETRKIPVFESNKVVRVVTIIRDITENKMAEIALKESEKLFRYLADNASDVVFKLTFIPERKFEYISPSCEAISGYTQEEFYADPHIPEKIVHPEYKAKLRKLQETGNYSESPMIYRQIKKDGAEFWTEHLNHEIVDERGRLVAITGIFRDITARVLAEEKLRKAEMEKTLIFDSLKELIIFHGPDMKIMWANRIAAESIGESVEIVKNRSCFELWHKRDSICENCPVVLALETGNPCEGEIVSPDGHTWLIRGYPVMDENGVKIGVVEAALDVTDRATAERALEEEKEKLSVTLRSISEGVITTDTAGRVELMNKVAEELTGFALDEARGKPLPDVFDLRDVETMKKAENFSARLLKSGGVVVLTEEKTLVAAQNRELLVELSGAPLRDRMSRVIGAVIVFRDVTVRRRMEEDLLKAQKLESIGVLAGGIAHDFNNILTAVLCNISLAKVGLPSDAEEIGMLCDAEKAALVAKSLTQQLLTFSKGGTPIRKPARIESVVEGVADFALSGSRSRCEIMCADDLWPVIIDEGQIAQVVNNMVLNSDQAMPEGGTIKICLENVNVSSGKPAPLPDGRYVRMSISDKGVGIAEDHLDRIFDPYFTTKERKSGLGLATSYSIVKKHDGYIDVESRPGAGTTFHVYLPASEVTASDKVGRTEKIVRGSGRILVMDDEQYVLDAVLRLLKQIGYEVSSAKNGTEMIDRYSEALKSGKPFDAVLIDLTVRGGMGGKTAIKELLRLDPLAKAIVSSGYSNDPVMSDYASFGFVDLVMKPYDVKELSEVLKRALES